MSDGDCLNRPEFDILDEMEKAAIEADLADPARAQRVLLGTVVVLRKEQVQARKFCQAPGGCKETFDKRLRPLERFKVWLIGLGAGVLIVGGAVLAVLEWLS